MEGYFQGSNGHKTEITYENGDKYIGRTKGWMRHAKGKLMTTDRGIYRGFWFNDLFYKGYHADDIREHVYEGDFRVKNGQYLYHGDGIVYYKDGILVYYSYKLS